MKFSILSLALALGLSSTASALGQTDQDLMIALHNLSKRAEVSRHTYLNTPRQLSKYAIFGGIGVMVVDALRADKNWAAVRKAPRFGAAIFLAGVASYYLFGLQQYVAVPQRMHNPRIIDTAIDLTYFFARPLHEQFEIAKDNRELRAFILDLNEEYEHIDRALLKYKDPTPQIKPKAG